MEPHVPPLPKARLGRWGPEVPRLGLGGEGILRTFGREAEAGALIELALAEGLVYLESARAYSGSEAYYGAALGTRRKGSFLATKAHDRTRSGVLAMLQASLEAMKTSTLDLWQLHDVRDRDELEALDGSSGAYAAFAEAKASGTVRAIGVTGHYDPAVLKEVIERFAFDAVLLPINPAEGALPDAFERTVIPAARARGMAVIGMKVLARGLLPPAGVRPEEAIRYALSADCDVIVIGCDDVAQLRENILTVRSCAPMSAHERAELERRVAPQAQRLAYYRASATL